MLRSKPVMICVALSFLLFACGPARKSSVEPFGVVGRWNGEPDVRSSQADSDDYGKSWAATSSLDLRQNGTFVFVFGPANLAGTWLKEKDEIILTVKDVQGQAADRAPGAERSERELRLKILSDGAMRYATPPEQVGILFRRERPKEQGSG